MFCPCALTAGIARTAGITVKAGDQDRDLGLWSSESARCLAVELLRSPAGRAGVLAYGAEPRLTEQVREFLASRGVIGNPTGECVLQPGVYIVGPSHRPGR